MATAYPKVRTDGYGTGYSNALDPLGTYNSTQYWRAAYLGAPTGAQTPSQLQQIPSMAASGIQNVEMGVMDPNLWDAIPKAHFAEIRQLAKLTIKDFEKEGKPSPISIHAPVLEPTGFDNQQNGRWTEEHWKEQQRIMADVVEKAAVLGASTPVNMHGSGVAGEITYYDEKKAKEELIKLNELAQRAPGAEEEYADEIARLKKNEIQEMGFAVKPETGELIPLQREWVQFPTGPQLYTPEKRLDSINHTQWTNAQKELGAVYAELFRRTEELNRATDAQTRENIENYIDKLNEHARSTLSNTFDIAIKSFEKAKDIYPANSKEASEYKKYYDEFAKMQAAVSGGAALHEAMNLVMKTPYPPIFIPVEKFGIKKAAESFANAALHSFDVAQNPAKFGVLDEDGKPLAKPMKPEQAPVICIENVGPTQIAGKSEGLRDLVHQARDLFAERLEKERKIPKAEAKKLADKLIGATWDVGHINLMRRYGYNEEKLKEEMKNIAKDVKHVHITDNFGFADAHLAPGMGNVPFKEYLKILEKEGKIKEIRGIVEASGYVQHFRESPWPQTLRYLNSPVYGWQAAPAWREKLGTYFFGASGYSAGYGNIFPEIHYGEYGSGFSVGLPPQRAPGRGGEQSKFAGTPVS